MNNLNTHEIASLEETFPLEKPFLIPDRPEIHYTPKHVSWLNIAEIELSVLKRPGLSGRIDCIEQKRIMVAAWNIDRNNRQSGVNWQFIIKDVRLKLKHLYPKH